MKYFESFSFLDVPLWGSSAMLQCLQELQLEIAMRSTHSMVISMRLPAESGKRLKRMANRHGWTPSDASARLV